jgi:hypothetical protein
MNTNRAIALPPTYLKATVILILSGHVLLPNVAAMEPENVQLSTFCNEYGINNEKEQENVYEHLKTILEQNGILKELGNIHGVVEQNLLQDGPPIPRIFNDLEDQKNPNFVFALRIAECLTHHTKYHSLVLLMQLKMAIDTKNMPVDIVMGAYPGDPAVFESKLVEGLKDSSDFVTTLLNYDNVKQGLVTQLQKNKMFLYVLRKPAFWWSVLVVYGDKDNQAWQKYSEACGKLLSGVEEFWKATDMPTLFELVVEPIKDAYIVFNKIMPKDLKHAQLPKPADTEDIRLGSFKDLLLTSFVRQGASATELLKYVNQTEVNAAIEKSPMGWWQKLLEQAHPENDGKLQFVSMPYISLHQPQGHPVSIVSLSYDLFGQAGGEIDVEDKSTYVNTIVEHLREAEVKDKIPAKCFDVVIFPKATNSSMMVKWNDHQKERTSRRRWVEAQLLAQKVEQDNARAAEIELFKNFLEMTLNVDADDASSAYAKPLATVKVLADSSPSWRAVRSLIPTAVSTLMIRVDSPELTKLARLASDCASSADELDAKLVHQRQQNKIK